MGIYVKITNTNQSNLHEYWAVGLRIERMKRIQMRDYHLKKTIDNVLFHYAIFAGFVIRDNFTVFVSANMFEIYALGDNQEMLCLVYRTQLVEQKYEFH